MALYTVGVTNGPAGKVATARTRIVVDRNGVAMGSSETFRKT